MSKMSHLHHQTFVASPVAEAELRLKAFFERNGMQKSGAHIALRATGKLSLVGGAFEAECDATIFVSDVDEELAIERYPLGRGAAYRVAWESAGGGPFPRFDGELRIEPEARHDGFWLVIDGSYRPPLGLAGTLFDQIAGSQVADSCARNLLEDIAHELRPVPAGARPLERRDFLAGTQY